MGTRKSATRLSATERDNFLKAVLTLKNTIANPTAPSPQQISIYDQFVAIHLYAININFGGSFGLNMGHQDSAFCPWHRYYLYKFEQALQTVDATVTLPYWDWTLHAETENILFQDNFMGPNGTGSTHNFERSVRSGYFAFNKPGTSGNPTPLPVWWPGTLAGWHVRPSLAQGHIDPSDPSTGNTLQRFFDAFTNLSNLSDIQSCLTRTAYEGSSTTNSFRRNIEAASKTHNFHHGWVGGNMGDPNSSPNDLIFFLHHCNIDRLWAMWQIDEHQGSAFYPASGRPQGHNLNDPMWPWVGGAAGYTSGNAQPDVVLPSFTPDGVKRPGDLLDHRALGYCYDSEAIVGIALDQTGSMNEMTPDPMVVAAPDVTKWEAAKRGVAALLHDCETAYTQRESYVIAGVKTFRTLGANVFTPVFSGVPYGIIKSGSGYSQSGFDAAIATQSPAGGTPLADALLDTENNLVRTPLSNLPAHDTRFLLMLTDGKLTSGQPLSSIVAGQLQDTVIFGMGFGTGTEVDYATIADIVSKGKAAPPSVTSQVYHGENAGEINKFLTNSIAHALGYTPLIDPIYQLYPGEHVDTAFYTTEADQSFMITVQGFDYADENWSICLILPDGSSCSCDPSCADDEGGHSHSHSHSESGGISSHLHDDFLVTANSKNGRTTIFLNRNGGEAEHWVGRWFVRVMYRMTDSNMRMFMPSRFDMLFPVGARAVRGPVFAQMNKPFDKRQSMRIQPVQSKAQINFPVTGVSGDRSNPSSVAVNIYCKSTINIRLDTDKEIVVGKDIALRFEANDITGGKVSQLSATARLVAPNFSVGNLIADRKVISLNARRKYFMKTDSGLQFNAAKFLADYEEKKPGAFRMRDEIIKTKYTGKNLVTANIERAMFPGIYRIGSQVSGTVIYGDSEPQYFSRILHYEIPVGLKIESGNIKPTLRIQRNVISVIYSLKDKSGNIPSPAQSHNAVLLLNGKEVSAIPKNDYSGTYVLESKMAGKGFELSSNGKKVVRGQVNVPLCDGEKLSLKAGDAFNLQLKIGNKKVNTFIKD